MTEPLKTRRFELREAVTLIAAMFIFVGAVALIAMALMPPNLLGLAAPLDMTRALEIYQIALPTAALVIGFWFNAKARE